MTRLTIDDVYLLLLGLQFLAQLVGEGIEVGRRNGVDITDALRSSPSCTRLLAAVSSASLPCCTIVSPGVQLVSQATALELMADHLLRQVLQVIDVLIFSREIVILH